VIVLLYSQGLPTWLLLNSWLWLWWGWCVGHCFIHRDHSVVEETQPARRADQIKTLLRNIGLPAPPVIGRKISAPPTAPISSSMATSGSGAAMGTLPAIPSSPSHRSTDAVNPGSAASTPRHSVSSLPHVRIIIIIIIIFV